MRSAGSIKSCNDDVPRYIEHDIARHEVAVDYSSSVKRVERFYLVVQLSTFKRLTSFHLPFR